MKAKSTNSSNDMLTWQFKTLLGEIQQVELHETGDCPCILNDLEPQERCLGKHLLNISTLSAETAQMSKQNEKWLLELAEEATERHEQFRSFICHEDDLPQLGDWARGWRKKHIEPIYYSCGVKSKLKEDTKLFEKPRTIRITGTKKGGAYKFKVSHTDKTEALTHSIAVDGKTKDDAISSSISAGLIDDYLSAPNLNETCRQYEGELAEPPVNAVDADSLEILQGLREEPPAQLFEKVTGKQIAKELDKCNLNPEELSTALAWRPLQGLLSTAIGLKAKTQLCSIGLVPGFYEVTLDNLTTDAEDKIAKIVMKTKNIKRIYTPTPSQRIYEVVVPRDGEKTELTFAPQEVSMKPARKEAAEQVALFEKTFGRLDWMPQKKVWRVIWYKGKRDIPSGDYPTREEAEGRLRDLIIKGDGTIINGGVTMSDSKSNLPVCTVTEAKKLERCIVKVKKKGGANPFAVCKVSVGCRKAGSQMSESGDTIKITGKCEDGPEKCTYTLRRVGNSYKIIGTKQLTKAIGAPVLKESVPTDVLEAIKHPVEVAV
ncbi:MAG: hypothetical protein Q8O55_03660 [Dehalococcoidales bacterium]|nr:hypothetical protein [Dehalococcoidales bacterium]